LGGKSLIAVDSLNAFWEFLLLVHYFFHKGVDAEMGTCKGLGTQNSMGGAPKG